MVLEAPAVAPADVPEGDVDTHLVAAVRRGDDRAFEELYTRCLLYTSPSPRDRS